LDFGLLRLISDLVPWGSEISNLQKNFCQAGPVSGTNFLSCSYGKIQPGYADEKGAKGRMGHFDSLPSLEEICTMAAVFETLSEDALHFVSDAYFPFVNGRCHF